MAADASLTPEAARERLLDAAQNPVASANVGWLVYQGLPSFVDADRARAEARMQVDAALDAILATTDALAVLVDWPALLEAGKRAGRVRSEHTHGDPPNTFGYRYWRLTEPTA